MHNFNLNSISLGTSDPWSVKQNLNLQSFFKPQQQPSQYATSSFGLSIRFASYLAVGLLKSLQSTICSRRVFSAIDYTNLFMTLSLDYSSIYVDCWQLTTNPVIFNSSLAHTMLQFRLENSPNLETNRLFERTMTFSVMCFQRWPWKSHIQSRFKASLFVCLSTMRPTNTSPITPHEIYISAVRNRTGIIACLNK